MTSAYEGLQSQTKRACKKDKARYVEHYVVSWKTASLTIVFIVDLGGKREEQDVRDEVGGHFGCGITSAHNREILLANSKNSRKIHSEKALRSPLEVFILAARRKRKDSHGFTSMNYT